MRTTVDIADDVLFAAKEIAKRDKKTLGEVLSELSRKGFQIAAAAGTSAPEIQDQLTAPRALKVSERIAQYGIHPLPSHGAVISNELIDRLREQEGI
jgi:hypothetical protein